MTHIDRINLLSHLTGRGLNDLAKELGMSRQGLHKTLTKQTRAIDHIKLKGICEYFGVPEKIFYQNTVHLVLKGDKLSVL